MALSDAVTLERVSRIVGYKITKGNFQTSSPNLPQRIAILAEANTANQATLDTTPKQITSAQEAGENYGFGSPIEIISRILFPKSGGGIGGIPVVVYPQPVAGGATSKILKVVPTGTATDNVTHTLIIAGRSGIDGVFYDININASDSPGDICAKMADAVNKVINAPMIGVDYDYETRFESKWKGKTADELNITVETYGKDAGISYAVTNVQSASGTPSISDALDAFGADWNTIVVNSYGTNSSIMSALESFNGRPDPTNPTGRFVGIVMKPFVAITGTIAEDPSAISDARLNDCTIAFAPAPLSAGLSMEAAANMTVLEAVKAQNTPHLDVEGEFYPDMPTPTNIGDMADYNNRDEFVKKGCSTVNLVAGLYQVQDFVTTYHKLGENPPQFRYVRNLRLDMNIRYSYYLLEQINVVDHVIAADADIVTAEKCVKPKQWKQVLNGLMTDLGKRGLINDVAFAQASIKVALSESNPDRLETKFSYKRSGTVRIASTTAEAGFNFGTL